MKVTITTNINVNNPKNPYEKFYADFWRRNFSKASFVKPDTYWAVWHQAHKDLNVGILESPIGKYKVDVEWDEVEYTLFCLKWA